MKVNDVHNYLIDDMMVIGQNVKIPFQPCNKHNYSCFKYVLLARLTIYISHLE